MNIFIGAIKWWYLDRIPKFLEEQVLATFIFSMNKTRALPFAKTFNVPLYKYDSGFGKSFSLIIKFWWISGGTFISIIKVIPPIIFVIVLATLPSIPVLAIFRLITLILQGNLVFI